MATPKTLLALDMVDERKQTKNITEDSRQLNYLFWQKKVYFWEVFELVTNKKFVLY